MVTTLARVAAAAEAVVMIIAAEVATIIVAVAVIMITSVDEVVAVMITRIEVAVAASETSARTRLVKNFTPINCGTPMLSIITMRKAKMKIQLFMTNIRMRTARVKVIGRGLMAGDAMRIGVKVIEEATASEGAVAMEREVGAAVEREAGVVASGDRAVVEAAASGVVVIRGSLHMPRGMRRPLASSPRRTSSLRILRRARARRSGVPRKSKERNRPSLTTGT